jgi:hypothetical protein
LKNSNCFQTAQLEKNVKSIAQEKVAIFGYLFLQTFAQEKVAQNVAIFGYFFPKSCPKSCPNETISPNLVTLVVTHFLIRKKYCKK